MLCKMAIDTFVNTKAKINPTHEYAIVSLTNKAKKVSRFSFNVAVHRSCTFVRINVRIFQCRKKVCKG